MKLDFNIVFRFYTLATRISPVLLANNLQAESSLSRKIAIAISAASIDPSTTILRLLN
jgi:hypothetical protein